MDYLPKTLLTLMHVVNEQYSNFVWTSHEEKGKMRISLIWNNDSGRHKSKATKRRDRRRYEQFLNKKSNSGESSDCESINSSERTDSDNDITDNEFVDKMDTIEKVNKPHGAPMVVKLHSQDENHPCVKLSSSDKQLPVDNTRVKVKVTNSVAKSPAQPISTTHDCNTQPDSDDSRQRKIPRRSVEENDKLGKVVMKVSGFRPDYLLALVPGTKVVIEHKISMKETKLVRHGDQGWYGYVKNIENDFDDVRTTKFMNDEVLSGILQMEQFLSQILPK